MKALGWLLSVTMLAPGCWGSTSGSAESPSKGAEVVIPEVSAEDEKHAKDEPTPAAGTRQHPTMPEEPVGPEPGSPEDMWGGLAGGSGPSQPRGGPDCDRAADCCLKFYQKSGGDPSVHRICGSMRIAPSTMCPHLLSSFQSTAPSIGVQCP